MSIRTVFISASVPFALLACSASAGPEATDEQTAAIVRPRPPPSLCGIDGWPACTSGAPCQSGILDINGTCAACGSIHTTLSDPSLQMGSDGFAEAVVNWNTTPAAPVVLTLVNTTNGQYQTHYSYAPGGGTWTFPGLLAGATYDIRASPFEPGEAPCGASAAKPVTTPASSVTLDLSASDSWTGSYSKGALTIHQDGTWYVSGAYIQIGAPTDNSLWTTLTCSADPGQTWPTWGLMIGFNAVVGPTANLQGSGQSAGLTADWLKITQQMSANCRLYVSWPNE